MSDCQRENPLGCKFLTIDTINDVLSKVVEIKICPGNQDFPGLIKEKLDIEDRCYFKDQSGKVIRAEVQNSTFSGISQLSTIRVSTCSLVTTISNQRCKECQIYRRNLQQKAAKRRKNLENRTSDKPSPFANNRWRSRVDLIDKCDEQQKVIKSLRRSLDRKDDYIRQLIEDEGCELKDEQLSGKCFLYLQSHPKLLQITHENFIYSFQQHCELWGQDTIHF